MPRTAPLPGNSAQPATLDGGFRAIALVAVWPYVGPRPSVYLSACPTPVGRIIHKNGCYKAKAANWHLDQPARAIGPAMPALPGQRVGPLSIFCPDEFWQPIQGGGEGRTRTFEAMRRLIYSQLPLPLGTLPRPTASEDCPPEWRRTEPKDGADAAGPMTGCGRRVYGRSRMAKSTNGSRQRCPRWRKLP